MSGADSNRQSWLAALRQSADAPPTAPRAPLTLGAPPIQIGSIEASLAERMHGAGLLLRTPGSHWLIEAPPDTSLAAIAHWLHANRLGGPWRNELLAVTDPRLESLAALASVERAAVRPLGITTFAVHLVAMRADGHVWVQQRADDKATDPGQWDTTMGGQVGAGESMNDALTRETWEEAGLRRAELQDLRKMERLAFRRPVSEGYLVEHIDVFEARLADATTPVNQDGEVQAFECLAPDTLIEWLLAGKFTLEAAVILCAWLRRRDLF
jgi:isopentenyldiphosphate isomerase